MLVRPFVLAAVSCLAAFGQSAVTYHWTGRISHKPPFGSSIGDPIAITLEAPSLATGTFDCRWSFSTPTGSFSKVSLTTIGRYPDGAPANLFVKNDRLELFSFPQPGSYGYFYDDETIASGVPFDPCVYQLDAVPVPEPASVLSVGCGLAWLIRGRKGSCPMGPSAHS